MFLSRGPMEAGTNRRAFWVGLVVAVTLTVTALVGWIIYSGSSSRGTGQPGSPVNDAKTGVYNSVSSPLRAPEMHVEPKSGATPAAPSSESDSIWAIAYAPSLAEAIRIVGRTSNVVAQEYALSAPRRLCGTLKIFKNAEGYHGDIVNFDAGTLTTRKVDVDALVRASRPAIARIEQRCQGIGDQGLFLEGMAKAAILADMPMASLQGTLPSVVDRNMPDLTKARQALDRLLSMPSGVDLFPLAATQLVLANPALLMSEMPPADNSSVQASRLGVAALEIAACRAGAACGEGSLARDRLCVAYFDCNGGDVEAAYRRLAARYGIPFDGVERAVERLHQAIVNRDVKILIPSGQ